MNNYELEAARRRLFFSIPEAARLVGNVRDSTWHRWEHGHYSVPNDVEESLIALLEWRQDKIDESVKYYEKAIEEVGGESQKIHIIVYDDLGLWLEKGNAEIYWRPQQSVVAEVWERFCDSAELICA